MSEHSEISNRSLLYRFFFGSGRTPPSTPPPPSPRPSGGPPDPEFNAWAPVEGFYGSVKRSFLADKATAGRKFFRFGPKVRVSAAGESSNPLLRDVLLNESVKSISGLPTGGSIISEYENWLKKEGPALQAQRAQPTTYGEGIYQAGFTTKDLTNPIGAARREFRTLATTYVWDKLEHGFGVDQQYGPGNVREGQNIYPLRQHVEEWGRVKKFLDDRLSGEVIAAAKKAGISDSEIKQYLEVKPKQLGLQAKIRKLQTRIGPPSPEDLDALPTAARELIKVNSQYSPLLNRIDGSLDPSTLKKLSQTKAFIAGKEGFYSNLANRHWATKWFAPASSSESLFTRGSQGELVLTQTGRAWQIKSFLGDPLGYTFKNYLWKKGDLPQILGGKGVGLGEKIWEKAGPAGLAYKKGVFTPGGIRALYRVPGLGGFPRWLAVRLRFVFGSASRFLTPVATKLLSTVIGLLGRMGLKGLGAALGSVVPGVGTVVGAFLGSFAEKALKGILKASLGIIACACSCLALVIAIPVAVVIIIASSIAPNIGVVTQGLNGVVSAIGTAIFQPTSAATTGDLLLTASANKTQSVAAGETLTITLTVTAYREGVGDIILRSEIDNNFSFGGQLGGGGASGKAINWPAFTISRGQTRQFSYTVTTSGGMSVDTEAVIKSSAASLSYTSSANLYFNRRGNNLAADGRHAFPVLKSAGYFWYNCHWHQNFNARDIRTDPAGGTPVVAVISGLAIRPLFSVGPAIIILGEDGLTYYYGHLRQQNLVFGLVTVGQIIGEIAGANEGYSQNQGVAHVHFSIDRWGNHTNPGINAGDFLNQIDGTNVAPDSPECRQLYPGMF